MNAGLLSVAGCAALLAGVRSESAAVAATQAVPARLTAACSQMQPHVDLSKFGRNSFRIEHPRIVHRAIPLYPSALIDASVHGVVSICVLVTEAGHPTAPTMLLSSGSKILDAAAMRAARATTFKAGTINGKPLKMPAELDYRFALK